MRKPSLELIVKLTLSLAAGAFLVVCAYVMLSRMAYPFELEWMEGGSLVQAWRIRNSLPLYTPPSIDTMPYIYPPFYYALSAFFALFTGYSFLPLRLVSAISTLAIILLIYRFTSQETNDRWLGLIAAGLFAGAFRLTGAWFDIARVDMLFLALFLAGAYLVRFPVKASPYLVPALFTLAYFTKQTILLPIAAVFLWQVLTRQRGAWRQILIFGGLTLLASIVLNAVTDGWFFFYNYTLPAKHQLTITRQMLSDTLHEQTRYFILLLLLSIPYFVSALKKRTHAEGLFYGALLLSLGLLSYLARLNPGGYDNVFIPFVAALAIAGALGLGVMLNLPAEMQTQSKAKHAAALLGALAAVLLTLQQFKGMRYDIAAQIPTPADRAAGEALLETLAAVNGEVYNSSSSYLNLYIGKPAYAHTMTIWELEGRFGDSTPNSLHEEFAEAAQGGRFAGILDDNQETLLFELPKDFSITKPLGVGDLLIPVTGWDNRPETLYLRAQP